MKRNRMDLVGLRFGRLLVVEYSTSDKNGNTKFFCKCDCGECKVIYGQSLKAGATLSCGCLNKEIVSSMPQNHHMSHTSYYKAWAGMIQRCTNPQNHKWQRYGGRGISVCKEWRDFENFQRDMGERPPGMTLDRTNNNGDYTPSNCRWATATQQQNNMSTNVRVSIDGEPMTIPQASRAFGISRETIRSRIRSGWDAQLAVQHPTNQPRN